MSLAKATRLNGHMGLIIGLMFSSILEHTNVYKSKMLMIYNLKNLTVKNMAPNLYVDCHPSSGLG